MSSRYFIRFKGRVLGPMTQDKVMDLVQRGQVTRHHELSPDGIQWRTADSFEEFYPKRPPEKNATRDSTNSRTDTEELRLGAESESSNSFSLPTDKWFVHVDGAQLGPVEDPVIKQWVGLGKVTADTLVWKEGMAEWLAASLVRPQWFSPAAAGRSTLNQHVIEEAGTSAQLQAIVKELQKNNTHVYIVGIAMLLLACVPVIASIRAITEFIASPSTSGGEALMRLLMALLFLGISIIGFFACFRTIQYANIVTSLRYAPTYENLLKSTKTLSSCWYLAGVFTSATIIFLAGSFLINYAAGIRLWHLMNR